MEKECIFNCLTCDGRIVINSEEPSEIPECCGKPMVRVDADEAESACRSASTAEHARLDNADAPCDDGRAG